MTQAFDLGGIPNQVAALYRARVNVNFQAVTTQHYGATEPAPLYPNMVWFSSGDGYIKIRNPTNTGWAVIGTIGPPMKYTNVDLPQTAWITGDVKTTYRSAADPTWVMMNDGTIGDASSTANCRANPDTWPLFWLLWMTASDEWCSVLAPGTYVRTGHGPTPESDFAAHRHIILPRVLGRALAGAGTGSGLSALGMGTWQGQEGVSLGIEHLPPHAHSFGVPAHDHPGGVNRYTGNQGTGGLAANSGNIPTGMGGGFSGNTSSAGSGGAHSNIQPTTYLNVMIKL